MLKDIRNTISRVKRVNSFVINRLDPTTTQNYIHVKCELPLEDLIKSGYYTQDKIDVLMQDLLKDIDRKLIHQALLVYHNSDPKYNKSKNPHFHIVSLANPSKIIALKRKVLEVAKSKNLDFRFYKIVKSSH